MKTMALEFLGVRENGDGLTVAVFIPCTDGAGAVPTTDNVSGSVPDVPLVLERDPSVFLVNQI